VSSPAFEVSLSLGWLIAMAEAVAILGCLWVVGRLRQQHDPEFQPLLTEDGPAIREFVKPFGFTNLRTGQKTSLWDVLPSGPTVILFLTGDCPPCRQILESAALFAGQWVRSVQFLVVYQGSAEEAREFLAVAPAFDAAADPDGALSSLYGISRWPLGIMVGTGGVVWNKGVVNTPRHLEGLVMGRGKPIEGVSQHEVSKAS
jgi:thiol-disulfide isomerase/thioredoxin